MMIFPSTAKLWPANILGLMYLEHARKMDQKLFIKVYKSAIDMEIQKIANSVEIRKLLSFNVLENKIDDCIIAANRSVRRLLNG